MDALLFREALAVAGRVLGHLDRNPVSPTFGYFGRSHWSWKTAELADAANQYALYYLALLWATDRPDNPFHHGPRLVEWIAAALRRWVGLQHRDGSFDQVFPHEHSVGATSYTVQAALLTLELLGQALPEDLRRDVAAAATRAGEFLARHDETYGLIANHRALFALTFHELAKLTGNSAYRDLAQREIGLVERSASAEGWFLEYEGADPGYQTQCLYYLARMSREGYDAAGRLLGKAVDDFLPFFFLPDDSFAGHCGCRNTSLVYPGGLAFLAGDNPLAGAMLAALGRGLEAGTTPTPKDLDFPNALRLASNYLVAARHLAGLETIAGWNHPLPCQSEKLWRHFPEAGLLAVATPHYACLVGLHKGGVLKVVDKASRHVIRQDDGYSARLGRDLVSSQVFSPGQAQVAEGEVALEHPFFRLSGETMTPWRKLVLLGLGLTVFRWEAARELVKRLLVARLITGKRPTAARLRRHLVFGSDALTVEDQILAPPGLVLEDLAGGVPHSAIHMASADYFDLSQPMAGATGVGECPTPGSSRKTTLRFPWADEQITTQVTMSRS